MTFPNEIVPSGEEEIASVIEIIDLYLPLSGEFSPFQDVGFRLDQDKRSTNRWVGYTKAHETVTFNRTGGGWVLDSIVADDWALSVQHTPHPDQKFSLSKVTQRRDVRVKGEVSEVCLEFDLEDRVIRRRQKRYRELGGEVQVFVLDDVDSTLDLLIF